MKKVMFYCQYLAGMGHLVRSTEIIRSLVNEFQVCFVNGGQPIPDFEMPAAVQQVHLPPIREENGQLESVDPSQSIRAVKEQRKQKLLEAFEQFQPDGLMIECFPFSKHKLKFELIPLLDRAKAPQSATQPAPKIICSLRDLIMTQTRSAEMWARRHRHVCELIDQYFDLVLVHGDPTVQRLDEQFPYVDQLACEVYYTGYVAQSPPRQTPLSPEDAAALQSPAMIVASAGGGRFGYELLHAVVKASAILEPEIPHRFYLFTGPFMPEEQVTALQAAAVGNPNLVIRRYTPHLLNYLQHADLSISLGGYNTTMNILRTGVRSLIFPAASEEQTGEQTLRAEKLAQQGVLDLLTNDDLQPERLAAAVLRMLQRPPVAHTFDLNGAEQSAARLKELLYGTTLAARS
ncbi:MAG: hypothetical protein IGS38_22590 [Synechococcales cyanobacterium M58_A2018_015]|nr:hypothetical protein [Synechococcales cyanobacterium M58_A2018_015]